MNLLSIPAPPPRPVKPATPRPANLDLLDLLDPESDMIASRVGQDAYHTRLAAGTRVHPTRCSMELAVALLDRNEPGDPALANRVIERVLSLQDTDPLSDTHGVWPYFAEERLPEMNPPDRNWADFLGALCCEILVRHVDRIQPGLCERVRLALTWASEAICRRDITPDYTNIAIMGGGVTCCAGELLQRPDLLSFGLGKLEAVIASAVRHGSFPEYNSPTYTHVALHEASRVLRLVRHPDARRLASRIADIAWGLIASHWHPGTQEWAGPHARAYSDLISPSIRNDLSHGTGAGGVVPDRPRMLADCPPEAIERFQRLPNVPMSFRERCGQGTAEHPDRFATTYFEHDYCLGVFSHGYYWHQSRSLIAHIRNPNRTSVLRTRMLLNDRDFAGGGCVQAVSESAVLSSACLWSGTGAFHPIFDAPSDGVFSARSMELRVQVTSHASGFEQIGDRNWRTRVGDLFVHVYTLPAFFNGNAIEWHAETIGETSALRCFLIQGAEPVALDPLKTDLQLGLAIDLCRSPSPRFGSPTLEGDRLRWTASTTLGVPVRRQASARLW